VGQKPKIACVPYWDLTREGSWNFKYEIGVLYQIRAVGLNSLDMRDKVTMETGAGLRRLGGRSHYKLSSDIR
jgi:hypothetical protein